MRQLYTWAPRRQSPQRWFAKFSWLAKFKRKATSCDTARAGSAILFTVKSISRGSSVSTIRASLPCGSDSRPRAANRAARRWCGALNQNNPGLGATGAGLRDNRARHIAHDKPACSQMGAGRGRNAIGKPVRGPRQQKGAAFLGSLELDCGEADVIFRGIGLSGHNPTHEHKIVNCPKERRALRRSPCPCPRLRGQQ